MSFLAGRYAKAVHETARLVDWDEVESAVQGLVALRQRAGRLFVLGLGGSAGNASHLVNDFRKLAGIEAYAPTDNVSELTARINDEGWGSFLTGYLLASRLSSHDAILVLSVGGGDVQRGVSLELVEASQFAKNIGAEIYAIVGRDGGFVAKIADYVMLVPNVDSSLVTPISEAYQAVIWHGIVSHPELAQAKAHWESIQP